MVVYPHFFVIIFSPLGLYFKNSNLIFQLSKITTKFNTQNIQKGHSVKSFPPISIPVTSNQKQSLYQFLIQIISEIDNACTIISMFIDGQQATIKVNVAVPYVLIQGNLFYILIYHVFAFSTDGRGSCFCFIINATTDIHVYVTFYTVIKLQQNCYVKR